MTENITATQSQQQEVSSYPFVSVPDDVRNAVRAISSRLTEGLKRKVPRTMEYSSYNYDRNTAIAKNYPELRIFTYVYFKKSEISDVLPFMKYYPKYTHDLFDYVC